MRPRTFVRRAGAVLAALLLPSTIARAQTPQGTIFTYQGRLSDGATPASGAYDFQFILYDAAVGGSQVGPRLDQEDVVITGGLFTVGLDFGPVFDGNRRFLDVAVRPGDSTGAFVPLTPRQDLTSAPAALFGAAAPWAGVLGKPAGFADDIDDDSGGTVTSVAAGPGLSGGPITTTGSLAVAFGGTGANATAARSDHHHDTTYVRNTTTPQTGVNFNIDGTGTAAVLAAATQFNLGGVRVLANPGTNNLFAGVGAGAGQTTGVANAYFGANAGAANTTGGSNSFFGFNAGRNTTGSNNSFFGDAAGFSNTTGGGAFFGFLAGFSNTTGGANSFFGRQAGRNNTTGTGNSFFGDDAGRSSTTGIANSFFGRNAGLSNTAGSVNSFFGEGAGANNTTGGANVFLGREAGFSNATGNDLTVVGTFANVGADGLSFATALGAGAIVAASNTVVLGRAADTVQVPGAMAVGGTVGAGIVNAAVRYDVGGARILGEAGVNNLFAGIGAGQVNTGEANSFIGRNAGRNNTSGFENSFFGSHAGWATTTGAANSFFGREAGALNVTGFQNSFFGHSAGRSNTAGADNSFFGFGAGAFNTTGLFNSFFGYHAGSQNTTGRSNAYFGMQAGERSTGDNNTFVGHDAGRSNTTGVGNSAFGQAAGLANVSGSRNTMVGWSANLGESGLFNATAIGANALAAQSNSLVLGSINGVNQATSSTNVGIGTTTPAARLHIVDGGNILFAGSPGCPGRAGIVFAASVSPTCQNYALLGGDGSTYVNRPSGGAMFFREGNLNQVIINPGGVVSLASLGAGGSQALCRNVSGDISTCSSSARYKTDVRAFSGGLDVVARLRPVSFAWKGTRKRDVGLIAEETARVEPLLTTTNAEGQVEGVNYAQLNVVLINAIKEQQAQIREQGAEIRAQRKELERLQAQVGALTRGGRP